MANKTVGILTFHCAHNYGAMLQAYATQELLRGAGHQVEDNSYPVTQCLILSGTFFFCFFVKRHIARKWEGFLLHRVGPYGNKSIQGMKIL